MKLPTPVWIDGTLYVAIAVFLAIQTYFGSDEAYKYCNPFVIFYVKGVCAVIGSGCAALKMYRSRTYSDSVDQQQKENSK